MGVQACRLPAPKPGKPSKPLKRLKPFKTLKTLPKRLGPDPLLFLTVQFAVHQAFAANRQPKATSMASYGHPSLPFASPQTPKTLQTPITPKTLKALKISKLSQQASQGHINGFLWASKLAVCQPLNPYNPPNP